MKITSMNSCSICIYRTSMQKTIYDTVYNNLRGCDEQMARKETVVACGYNPGMPVEIDPNRVICSQYQGSETGNNKEAIHE